MFLLDKPQQKGDFANIPTEVGNCSVLMLCKGPIYCLIV